MNRSYRNEVKTTFFVFCVQVRLMLEKVCIQLFIGKLLIRLNIVVECYYLQTNALSFQLRFDALQNFSMRCR
ncbi:hypothetical protein D3C76_1702390 [compost metagenome]